MKEVVSLLVALLLALPVLGCGQDVVGTQEITGLPRELSRAESGLVEAGNAFGLALFQRLHGGEGTGANLFVSPLSVAMALGMAYNGAAGGTQEAMQKTLRLQGLSIAEVNESYRSLIGVLRGLDPSVEFLIANSIWYDSHYTFEESFLEVNREFFDAEVRGLDFASPGAAPTINEWVEAKTGGRIDEIVADPIASDLVMFLINAIYFKGDWTRPFDEELTRPADFTLADGSVKQVETMYYAQADSVLVFRDDAVAVLDLAYGGRAFRMTIAMPAEGSDVGTVVGALDRWGEWVDGLSPTRAVVALPKYTLEYEVELKSVLGVLGMEVAFDPQAADFTKIYSGSERLHISKVKHKSFVEVNEEGTEAAAATSVGVGITSLPPMIAIDRPFVFAIRERFSGTILFLGVVFDPAAG